MYEPFFLKEPPINGENLPKDVNQLLDLSLVIEVSEYIFPQDGVPPHWYFALPTFINLNHQTDGLAVLDNMTFSIGDMPRTFYEPALSAYALDYLQEHISESLRTITLDMLQKVWAEADYRIDVCSATKVERVKCL